MCFLMGELMSKTTKVNKKPARTLRQTTADKAGVKKRSLKAPVRKLGQPFKKVGSAARKGKTGKIGRFLVPKYFRYSYKELKEVTWPDRHKTVRLTFAVIAFATVFGIVIAIVDFGLDKLFRELLLK